MDELICSLVDIPVYKMADGGAKLNRQGTENLLFKSNSEIRARMQATQPTILRSYEHADILPETAFYRRKL
ncbi:hypothetical protein RRG08_050122 [Elysia crispata]|uniref:Uncharacterized protein n=1 Tax=Elysia crispata TaxID=231223 RepID=A0AAE0Z697_9GAST|nr:hypothetical protein RRG08_050122 [Elysia crispata]